MTAATDIPAPGRSDPPAADGIHQSARKPADPFNLDRFVRAQAGCFAAAVAELEQGEKRTHWMWFIFPQMLGLGKSANARLFAISSRDEALAYCEHELLGPRLVQCTQAMLAHAEGETAGDTSAIEILGVIDAMKFHSCMTLFDACCPSCDVYARALDTFFDGKRDAATLEKL